MVVLVLSLQDATMAKIADDLCCGGNIRQELFHNLQTVLQALHKCNPHLCAHKTINSPKSTYLSRTLLVD